MLGGVDFMAERLEDQIRQALWQCSVERMSLDDFRAWFVPRSLNIEECGEPAAIELAHRIDGILAEASSAGWSDDELREELSQPLRQPILRESIR